MDSNNIENKDQQKFIKRKKKRSYMQQVKKKFKKSASFSKGSRFDEVEYEYFMHVFELERVFEGSSEEKVVFANNALAQTEGREVQCSYNQLVSRVIENLLPLATNAALEKYFEAFTVNLRPICVHRFASHVLQALMITATTHYMDDAANTDFKHIDECKAWLLKVSAFMLNNIEEFMWDSYANPVLRTVMLCLAGMPQVDKHNKAENKVNKIQYTNIPKEFSCLLEEFYSRISTWQQFKDLVDNPLSSGYLQCLLHTLKPTNKKLYKSLCNKVLRECFPSQPGQEDIPNMFSPTALPVLEVMVEQSKRKLQKKIYEQFLCGRLKSMATARVANITLQKFVNKCHSPEMLGQIVSELMPHFPEVLESRHEAVLVSLAQACHRLTTSQTQFVQSLMTALNCENELEGEKLVTAVLSVQPLPHDTPTATKFGSLLIQSLLRFQKPIKLVNSLLSYEPKQLAELLSSMYGSHITGAFCSSEYIGEKSRQRLIQRLMGHYPYLAQSKFGSRSFDDIWAVADLKMKVQIVKDLASGYSQLMTTQCGQFIASKVRLTDFKTHGVDKWRERIQSIQAKQKLFAPIIGGDK